MPITIVGLVLGIKSRKSPARGMAIAGIVLCILGLVLAIVNAAIGAYQGARGQHWLIDSTGPPQAARDWPPVPDFKTKFDYIKWYEDQIRGDLEPEDNAYELYRKIFGGPDETKVSNAKELGFAGFYHIRPTPPKPWTGPWNPDEHPEWENSYQRTKDLLARFKEAAAMRYYGFPLTSSEEAAPSERSQGRTSWQPFCSPESRVNISCLRVEARRHALRLLYTIHIYRDQHGRWPAHLTDLPEKVLVRFGTDPFSNKPFGYRLVDGEPLLYSAALDSDHDGGKHDRRWGEDFDSDEIDGDFVFWPIPELADR